MSGVPSITRDRLLEVARSLPAAPQAMAGLYELLQDANVDLGRIAEQISLDPALAARVVRMSNSVGFGGSGDIGSVDEAVSRVGFAQIMRLVGAATVATLVDRNLAGYGLAADHLRKSLLLHALACEALARGTSIDPRTAYTAGLLRAVGMMVLARVAVEDRRDDVYDRSRHPTYADWEWDRFGWENGDVLALVLTEWRFPSGMVEALRGHLKISDAGNGFACLLNLGGAIVAEAGLALPGDEKHWGVTPEKFAMLGLDEECWQAAGAQARALFQRMVVALE